MKKNLNVEDTYRHKGLRRQLVEELKQKGIADPRVLAALEALPRHLFMDKAFEDWAYQDKAFPIGNDQTISQPYTVAYMTSLLSVEKRCKILEVGTGSGYQAALLALLGGRVFTLERQEALYQQARERLRRLGFRGVRCFYRDGTNGLPEHAPYDRIIVTAGAPQVPEALLGQLRIGGLLVIPVGKENQKMYRIHRIGPQEYQEEVFARFRFVPFLKGLEKDDPQSS